MRSDTDNEDSGLAQGRQLNGFTSLTTQALQFTSLLASESVRRVEGKPGMHYELASDEAHHDRHHATLNLCED